MRRFGGGEPLEDAGYGLGASSVDPAARGRGTDGGRFRAAGSATCGRGQHHQAVGAASRHGVCLGARVPPRYAQPAAMWKLVASPQQGGGCRATTSLHLGREPTSVRVISVRASAYTRVLPTGDRPADPAFNVAISRSDSSGETREATPLNARISYQR